MRTDAPALSLLAAAFLSSAAALTAQDAIRAVSPFGTVHVDRPRNDEPTVWVRGDRYKASIDGDACTFVPFLGAEAERAFPLRLSLEQVRVGSAKLDLAPRDVATLGHRVTVARADVAEVYDASVDHLKQSFRFDRLPAARGELEIVLGVTTELSGRVESEDLSFTGPGAHVGYSDLVVVDAAGKRCELPIAFDGGRIRLRVPADFVEGARLPLVVDPVFGTRIIASVPDSRMYPDVAFHADVDEYLVVWNVPFSTTDQDVAAVRTDSSFNPIGASFWIDFTTASWVGPRVACKGREGMFLVVAQVNRAGIAPFWISGRRYEAVGAARTLHAQQDIEKQTMSGSLPGDSFRPDVCGDPWRSAGPAHFTVVYEYRPIGGNGDIVARHLHADGTWVYGAVSAINVGTYDDQAPSVSKSAGNIGRIGIVWHQYGGGGAGNIVATVIDARGQQIVPVYYLDSSNNDDTRPRISMPARLPGTDRSTFLVAWQRNQDIFANVGRLHGAAITDDVNVPLIQRWDLSSILGVPSNRMAYEPVVESDGLRFAIAHSESQNALPGQGRVDLFASTVAVDGTQLLAHEARAPLWNSGPSAFTPSIVSHHGADNANSRVYGIVSATNAASVVGYVYAGTQPGASWNVRAGGCGGLPLQYSGRAAFGEAVHLSVGGTAPLRGIVLGFPAPMTPLAPCPSCLFGVANPVTVSSPYTWHVPYLPAFVGFTLSAQGFAVDTTGPCLGQILLSDVVDFTLR